MTRPMTPAATAYAADPPLAADPRADAEGQGDEADDDGHDRAARRRSAAARPAARPSDPDGDARPTPDRAAPARQAIAIVLTIAPRRAAPSPQLLAQQEQDHDEVGADEEHDEPLDDERQVRRELGLEDLRVEVARRRARCSAPKRSAARPMPTAVFRPRSATAMPRNPIVEPWMSRDVEPELPAEDVERAGEPREGAGDRHREEVVPRDADAAVARGLGVEARPRAPRTRASCG